MKFTNKMRLLALLCVAGAACTAQANQVLITGWITNNVAPNMNSDYVPVASGGWTIPIYNNQVVIPKNTILTGVNIWSNQYTYVLLGACMVGNPTNSLITGTLYIQPGTVIRGYPPATGSDTVPGGLYSSAGSQTYARGTKDAPIIMTDMWDNNVPGMAPGYVNNHANYAAGVVDPDWNGWYNGYLGTKVGTGKVYFDRDYSVWQPVGACWGGMVFNGRCSVPWHKGGMPSSADPSPNMIYPEYKTTQQGVYGGNPQQDEGLANLVIYYGGADGIIDDDDNSGCFVYCSIRYNGYPLATGTSEINGLSLYGVGRGTEIHHVEIMNTADDSIEWFGGTVNQKYCVTWAYGDDGWDTDDGYRGKNQFMFAVKGTCCEVINTPDSGATWQPVVGSLHSDKGMEMDSSGDNDPNGRGLPIALSSWWNGTWVGQGKINPATGYPDVTDTNINWATEYYNFGVNDGNCPEVNKFSLQPAADTGLMLRHGASPQIFNGIFCELRGAGIVCDYVAVTNGGPLNATTATRQDVVEPNYVHDVLTRAGYPWNYYPPVTNVFGFVGNGAIYNGNPGYAGLGNPTAFDNWEYQSHIPTYQMDIAGNVFYAMGYTNSILPTAGWDLVNAAGRETSGTKNSRHVSIHWNDPNGTTTYADTKDTAHGNSGIGMHVAAGSGNTAADPSAFPGLTSGTLSPNVATAVNRINSANTLTTVNPIGAIVRVPESDYRYCKGVRNISFIDPYPVTDHDGCLTGAVNTNYLANDSFYTPVAYKGAFDPNAVNWLADWSLCDKFNLVAMHREKAYNVSTWTPTFGGVSGLSTQTDARVAATIGNYPAVRALSPVVGETYVIQAASNLSGPWTTVGTITEDGSTKWFTDASGANHNFFRVSRSQ